MKYMYHVEDKHEYPTYIHYTDSTSTNSLPSLTYLVSSREAIPVVHFFQSFDSGEAWDWTLRLEWILTTWSTKQPL